MVSFWPWKGDASSTASFEKTLSLLSAKIRDAQSRLEKLRTRSRRARVLTTLYLSFAYLVYAIVLVLVIGRAGLGSWEWTGLAAGPVVIYAVRYLLVAYYTFRMDSLSSRLKTLQDERTRTIEKLKDATRYNSTLQLLEKYGDHDDSRSARKPANKSTSSDNEPAKDAAPAKDKAASGRVFVPPPPTANIQPPSHQNPSPSHTPPPVELLPGAEFAPNAFSPPTPEQSSWYDRIFDALLGEDTDPAAPRNRFALLCRSCRRVNGLAPPDFRSLADVGLWHCMFCNAPNGEAEPDEGKRIVRDILDEQQQQQCPDDPPDTPEAKIDTHHQQDTNAESSATATEHDSGRRRKPKNKH